MDELRRGDTNQRKSSKKKSRDQRKAIKASGSTDKTQEKPIDTKFESKPLDVLKKHIEPSEKKSESSQLPNHSHEQIEILIKTKKKEKEDFESAFKDLQRHIQIAKSRISEEVSKQNAAFQEDPYFKDTMLTFTNSKLMESEFMKYLVDKQSTSNQENSSNIRKDIEDLLQKEILEIIQKDPYLNDLASKNNRETVEKQIAIIEEYHYLNGLMLKNLNDVKNENNFLLKENTKIFELRDAWNKSKEIIEKEREKYTNIFRDCGIDLNAHLIKKHPEPPKFLSIDSYYKEFALFSSNYHSTTDARITLLERKRNEFHNNEFIKQLHRISLMIQAIAVHRDYPSRQRNSQEIRGVNLSSYDRCKNELNVLRQHSKITQDAKKKFEEVIDQDNQAIRKAYTETLQAHQEYGGPALHILNQAYLEQLKGRKINKEDILNKFQKKHEIEEKFMQRIEKILKENANLEDVENEKKILRKGLNLTKEYLESLDEIINKNIKRVTTDYRQAISYYDFVEKNITHRLSNSLDELEKKSQEALIFLEDEIKELQLLHSQRQSEQSAQPPMSIEKPSPANKLQEYLDSDADVTDQRKPIVASYMHGLFEKSHHRSLDDKTTTNFYEKNIKEAKQIGEYLEQMHFAHKKIRDDVIQFAIHLKHEFGFPLHQADIDADFNIIKSDPSKDGSSSTSGLDIDRQGRILKDGRVQRVYLIGFQDSSKASSSAEPMALLAIQSTDTPYPKYGAGTPLPTGGVVDVLTAQSTTRDQPNLYKAILAIETLQETHNQKEVDMQTLELFETETAMNPHTKAPLYDVTTFIGKVKDSQNQATSHDSKEYRETTGPCIVDLEKLISAVKDVVKSSGSFCPSPRAMMYIKREIARQVLGEDAVPKSDQEWKENGAICWADFHEYSTSMNMFAKYLVIAYREELGLSSSK